MSSQKNASLLTFLYLPHLIIIVIFLFLFLFLSIYLYAFGTCHNRKGLSI